MTTSWKNHEELLIEEGEDDEVGIELNPSYIKIENRRNAQSYLI